MKELTKPPYLPFLDHPQVVHMGLSPLRAENWIEPDNQFLDYYENKLSVYAAQPQSVYAELPVSISAQKEFAARLSAYLVEHHNIDYSLQRSLQNKIVLRVHDHRLTFPTEADESCLWNAGLWIQDDVCLLQEIGGQYVLTAATLCAPSAWRLQDKIGRPMFDIHASVPGLNETIAPQINHVMAKLSPLRPFQRFNWSIKTTSQLALLPDEEPLLPAVVTAQGKESLYLRVERQTMSRLPKTNAIAFTIRIYLNPLEDLELVPGAIASLKTAINSMSAAEARYKQLVDIYPSLREFFKNTEV